MTLVNAKDDTDPITGSFKADGTAHDKVLTSIDVVIKPTLEKTNITLTVKTETGETEQPAYIAFVSGTKPPALPDRVKEAPLPDASEDTLIKNLVAQLNACYAIPAAQRANATTNEVIAATCRKFFLNDDPRSFLNDGRQVCSNGNSCAYSGLFSPAFDRITFSAPEIEFRYPDDQIRLRLKVTLPAGDVRYSRFRLKRVGNEFRDGGNQYAHAFRVRPWTEVRRFVNRPELSYYASGVNIFINNEIDGSGNFVFEKVVVTPPGGVSKPLEFFPQSSQSFLVIKINGVQTSTNNLRLAGQFIDPTTSGSPRRLSVDSKGALAGELLVWGASPSGANSGGDWTDAELDSIPEISRWKAEFYKRGATAPVVQYYETTSAPLVKAELLKGKWAVLTDKNLTDIRDYSSPSGSVQLTQVAPINVAWVVPEGAYAPNEISLSGFVSQVSGSRFNDFNSAIKQTDRTGTINCSRQSNTDQHCDSTGKNYAAAARGDGVSLSAYDERDMIWVSWAWSYLLTNYGK